MDKKESMGEFWDHWEEELKQEQEKIKEDTRKVVLEAQAQNDNLSKNNK